MSKDKDLEKIKNGQGLKSSNTTGSSSAGTTSEQRGQNIGIRHDTFTLNKEVKK